MLEDTSKTVKLTNLDKSAGRRDKWLSFRNKEVKWVNFHSSGLKLRTTPATKTHVRKYWIKMEIQTRTENW